MKVETNRLIIRDLEHTDMKTLHEIKYDISVQKYIPDYIKNEANMDDIINVIEYCTSVKDTGNFSREVFYPIVLKENNTTIGTITVSKLEYLYETQIGWQILSKYTNNGYASEAGTAVSDYLLSQHNLEFLSVVMDIDTTPRHFVPQ